MLEAIALAFGLAMDATAVAGARGILGARREMIVLPLLFGGFQAGMAAVGWLGGQLVGPYIAAWDHWVAFGLLVALGGKMILDGWRDAEEEVPEGTTLIYLGLALATSLDAAAAGLALPLVPVAPWLSLTLIGAITAGCAVAGFAVGRIVGARYGRHLAIVGGLVLIVIAIQLLVRGI